MELAEGDMCAMGASCAHVAKNLLQLQPSLVYCMHYDLVYKNQFITVIFREGEQKLLVALAFHQNSHISKPRPQTATQNGRVHDSGRKRCDRKRAYQKAITNKSNYNINVHLRNNYYCDGISITET